MERKFGIEEVTTVGTYANYNAAIGVNVANFNVHDVAMIVGMALHTDELRQQVAECQAENERTITHWKREVNGMQDKLTDAEIRVKEAQNDVRNAEAHNDELNGKLQHARAELQDERDLKTKFKTLSTFHYDNMEFVRGLLHVSEDVGDERVRDVITEIVNGMKVRADDHAKVGVYWYDALQKILKAVGGDEVFDTEGLSDDHFVEGLEKIVSCLRADALSHRQVMKRDDAHRIFSKQLTDVLGIQEDLTREGALSVASQIKRQADAYGAQENEWRRRYDELCNVLNICFEDDNSSVIAMAQQIKASCDRVEKQENYQRKYNELKGASGLSGLEHGAAVKIAGENPAR